jgi:lipopolysaccharide/colanic/teichoic acid biosynthesis glycosyltransferase
MIKRLFDIIFSAIGLILLSPILIIISILIIIDSKGPVFFRQTRVGQFNKDFKIFKFRTMYINSNKMGLLTVGDRDPRVTKMGYFLRKYKFDEFPQLINVLQGTMSLVGPRPEVRKYVDYYSKDDLQILNAKPGITDLASIEYRNEAELIKKTTNPEKLYIEEIMPAKIKLNKVYLGNYNLFTDIKIIFKTFASIVS